jgi:hypothetical protein
VDADQILTRLWLAAVLGLLLGLGIAYAPYPPAASQQPNSYILTQPFETQRLTGKLPQQAPQALQMVLVSLLIGVFVAAPFFLVARRCS